MDDIRASLERVRERVARAAERVGRRAEDVLLIGVSKTVEPARIREAIAAGVPALGGRGVWVRDAREGGGGRGASGAVEGDGGRFRGGEGGGGDEGARRAADLRPAPGRARVVGAAGRRGAGAPPSEASL